MTERIVVSRTAHGLRLALPADVRFDDYREIRAIVARSATACAVELELSRVDALPTWMLGLLLHVEESLGMQLAVVGASPAQLEVFAITHTLRFVRLSPAAPPSARR